MSTRRMQKNLTVMFTDISGFTRHTETISRDELMARLDTHNTLLMPIVAHFDGRIVKSIGDAFLITFESPTNGVQCGLFMQHTLRNYNAEKPEGQQIHLKISINSGEVTVTDSDVFGDPVNVAAKIEKATNPDDIYFTESVFLAMNKAEVPTSFVKTFRPRGAESQEIKLYKVAMDEGDERYQRVINATHIDAEKTRSRVLELSSVAEKEFTRYQDTLEALVQGQSARSRSTIIAVVAAALILAIAVIAGFALLGGESAEQQVVQSARNYLSAGKPEDARLLLSEHIRQHGDSEPLQAALREVDAYELNEATRRAAELLDSGQPARAESLLRGALQDSEPGAAQKQLLERAAAWSQAAAALKTGDTRRVLERIDAATGPSSNEAADRVREQARAIEAARAILADDDSRKERSNAAIERLAQAFGDQPENAVALALIAEALESRLYWEAREKGHEEGKRQLERYRERFLTLPDWRGPEREMHLGGFWIYKGDSQQPRWWRWEEPWASHYRILRNAAESDPAFHFRLAEEIYEINRHLNLILTTEQFHVAPALEHDPSLLETRRERILQMCRTWLEFDQTDDSLARRLAREHFFDDLREQLVRGLHASYNDRPRTDERRNSYALLADRAELHVIEDRFAYFRENMGMFMENDWGRVNPQGEQVSAGLTRAQAAMIFQGDMSAEEYAAFADLLERTRTDIAARTGTWGSYSHASETVRALIEDLKTAQPQHAG